MVQGTKEARTGQFARSFEISIRNSPSFINLWRFVRKSADTSVYTACIKSMRLLLVNANWTQLSQAPRRDVKGTRANGENKFISVIQK